MKPIRPNRSLPRKLIKVLLIIVTSLLLLVMLLVVGLNTTRVQNFLAEKIVAAVGKKIGTPIRLGHISIALPGAIVVEKVYLPDQKSDTLVYIGRLEINPGLLALLRHTVQVDNLDLSSATVNLLKRNGAFNFQYIIDSLSSPNKTPTEGKPWDFDVNEINLDHIRFGFEDPAGGQFLHVALNRLALRMERLQLDSLQFDIRRALLEGSDIDYRQQAGIAQTDTLQTATIDTTVSPNVRVEIGELAINNSKATYENTVSKQKATLGINQFSLENGAFSLLKQIIKAGNVELTNSSAAYAVAGENSQKSRETAPPVTTMPWTISLEKTRFSQNDLQYDDNSMPVQNKGFDPNHIHIKRLDLEGGNLEYGQGVSGNVASLAFDTDGDFKMKNLSAQFKYDNGSVEIKHGDIQTPRSRIGLETSLQLDTANVWQTIGSLRVDAAIDPSDIFYFAPQLQKNLPIKSPLNISADVGQRNDLLTVNSLKTSILNTGFQMKGTIKNPGDSLNRTFDIPMLQLTTHRDDLKKLLPDSLLPASLNLPPNFSLEASLRGTMNDLKSVAQLRSDYGGLTANVSLKKGNAKGMPMAKTSKKILDGKINLDQFDLGKLLANPQLGLVDVDLNLAGSGEHLKDADLKLDGKINRLDFKQYSYRDVQVKGSYDQQKVEASLSTDQKDLNFDLTGSADLSAGITAILVDLDLKNANLQALNLSNDLLAVQGRLKANLDTLSTDRINGKVGIRKLNVIKNGQLYRMDSLVVSSVDKPDKKSIKIQSDVLQAHLDGNVGLPGLPGMMRDYFRSYLDSIPQKDTANLYDSAKFDFALSLTRPKVLAEVLVPGLNQISLSKFEGHFNGSKRALDLDVLVPSLSYNSFTVDSLDFKVNSNDQSIDATLTLQKVATGSMGIARLQLLANTKSSGVAILARIPRGDSVLFRIAADVSRQNGRYLVHVDPDSVILNGSNWQMDKGNQLILGRNIWAKDFVLRNNEQELQLKPMIKDNKDTVGQIQFKQFRLASFGSIVTGKETFLSGLMGGHLDWNSSDSTVEGNLDIRQLAFRNDTIGHVNLKAQKVGNQFKLDLGLKQPTGDLAVSGTYKPEAQSPLDLTADFKHLAIGGVQSFVPETFEHLQGTLDGTLKIKGTTTEPQVVGSLRMDSLGVFPTYLNTWLYANGQTINFQPGKVGLGHFEFTDANKHKATLEGSIITDFVGKYALDLRFQSENFQVFNTTENDNDLYYGKALVSTDTKISGDLSLLHVKTNVTLNDGSTISVIVPQSNASLIQREGLVQFIDQDKKTSPFILEYIKAHKDTTTGRQVTGIDLQANIAVNDKSMLRIITDPDTDERLEVQGNANLSYKLTANGDMTLSGKYEIEKGDYYLNFHQLFKRDFNIVKGSFIQWSGDPMDALLNVNARYTVETQPPIGDVAKRLPFNVNLNITGKILSPSLHFTISMPEDQQQQYAQVSSYLQQINTDETELNKQMLSLVMFNTFMSSSSGGSGGTMLSNTARSSLSKFLTQQLNRLSNKVHGLSLNVDLQSYEMQNGGKTQGRTDLQLGLSQSLFNNRFTITISGNVNIEGTETQQKPTNVLDYADNVTLEYKLNPKGQFRLIGFRKNVYDGLLQGDIINTGVGIVFVKDYDRISELFTNADKEKPKPEKKDKDQ